MPFGSPKCSRWLSGTGERHPARRAGPCALSDHALISSCPACSAGCLVVLPSLPMRRGAPWVLLIFKALLLTKSPRCYLRVPTSILLSKMFDFLWRFLSVEQTWAKLPFPVLLREFFGKYRKFGLFAFSLSILLL